jgi:hypothetical protein
VEIVELDKFMANLQLHRMESAGTTGGLYDRMNSYYGMQADKFLSTEFSPQAGILMQRPSMQMPSSNSKISQRLLMHSNPLNSWRPNP